MDTLKILLGATVALLIGALAVSWQGLQNGTNSISVQQYKELQRQIQDINDQRAKLQEEKDKLEKLQITQSIAAPAQPDPAEVAALKSQLALAEKEKADAELKASTRDKEASFIVGRDAENRDGSARRTRMINDALLVGKVSEWVEDPNSGSFATVNVERPESVQQDVVLCIRRNGGILGKLKVTQVSYEGTIASPLTPFNEVKPMPGDELILEPPF
jgi:hypothetical protein